MKTNNLYTIRRDFASCIPTKYIVFNPIGEVYALAYSLSAALGIMEERNMALVARMQAKGKTLKTITVDGKDVTCWVTECPPAQARVPGTLNNEPLMPGSTKRRPTLSVLDGDFGDKDYEVE